MHYYHYRTPTWLDGVALGLAFALLVPVVWYPTLVFGDLAAMAGGDPLGISLAPVTGLLRALLFGSILGAELLLPTSMAVDARRQAATDGWQPNPGTYALGGLLYPLPVPVAVYYLLRRTAVVLE